MTGIAYTKAAYKNTYLRKSLGFTLLELMMVAVIAAYLLPSRFHRTPVM